MKQSINLYQFEQAFKALRPDNFSYEGIHALFEYLEQWEADSGEELELDVVALCCDFSEDTTQAIAANYSIDVDGLDDEEAQEAVAAHLSNEGAYVAHVAGGFVYRDF